MLKGKRSMSFVETASSIGVYAVYDDITGKFLGYADYDHVLRYDKDGKEFPDVSPRVPMDIRITGSYVPPVRHVTAFRQQ